jgi:N-acetylneuraminic acid mutarotase
VISIVLFFAFPVGQLTAAFDHGHWMTGTPASSERTEVAVAALDGLIYVAGGFEKPNVWNLFRFTVSQTVEAYNPAINRWATKASLPIGLHHAGAAALEGHVYIAGGFIKSGVSIWNPSKRVFRYSPKTNQWEERALLLTARGGLAVTVLQGKLYAISGYDGELNPDVVEVYDLQMDSWASVASLPTPRDHLTAVTVDDRMYAIGGRVKLDYHHNLGTVEVYDPVLNQWEARLSMPTARSGISAGVSNEWIYVFGGEFENGTFDANERYSPRLNRWEVMAPMPTARHGLGAAVVDEYVYVISGGPTPGGSFSNLNEIFIPPVSAKPMKTSRAPAQHVGAVMAILGTFDEAGVLPPEADPRANQLIRALIQFQSVFMKSQTPAVQEYFSSALTSRWGTQGTAVRDSFYKKGWTSEALEAMVDYSKTHAMWPDERMKEVFRQYYLSPADWSLVQEIFLAARQRFVAENTDIHVVFAGQRDRMACGEF